MRIIPLLAGIITFCSVVFIAKYNIGHVPFIFIFVSIGFGVAIYFCTASIEIAFNLKNKGTK